MARKGGALPLLLAGLAAWGYYKYSKMSEDQKRNLVGDLKEKGKRFYDENIPQNVKDMLGKKENGQQANQTQAHTQA
jgi:hypothetical protein